ncbi:hypothetical protein CWATWH0402_4614 [Crocosphaera watsonii WH 0402]|uniref:Uncharacterized protein n=1 Tax=Crocosphaera watsonii WH 0402 TaxID=1284629 RepID=T2JNU9_CROWT|nr:hypothetical protein CWATWH0402_4614 [Crocosphaera watsonii WH 0402]
MDLGAEKSSVKKFIFQTVILQILFYLKIVHLNFFIASMQ